MIDLAVEYKTIIQNVSSSTNTITITDALISNNSKIDLFLTKEVGYEISQSGTSVTIVFENHTYSFSICLVINNITSYSPYDDTTLTGLVNQNTYNITQVSNAEQTLENQLLGDSGYIPQLTSGLSLKQNITDNNLTTTNKTIVGAINEVKSSSGGSSRVLDYNEREIGNYFGMTLYSKLFDLSTALSGSSQTATFVPDYVDTVVFANAIRSTGETSTTNRSCTTPCIIWYTGNEWKIKGTDSMGKQTGDVYVVEMQYTKRVVNE